MGHSFGDMFKITGSNLPTKVEGFTDSDYAGNPDNQKSMSDYVFTYGGGAATFSHDDKEITFTKLYKLIQIL